MRHGKNPIKDIADSVITPSGTRHDFHRLLINLRRDLGNVMRMHTSAFIGWAAQYLAHTRGTKLRAYPI